jgi:hypothetical protein
MGRFMSPDPIAGNVMNPQSWNRYAYAANNPLKFTDPSGLRCYWDDATVDDPVADGGADALQCSNDGGSWYNDEPSNDAPTYSTTAWGQMPNDGSGTSDFADPNLFPNQQPMPLFGGGGGGFTSFGPAAPANNETTTGVKPTVGYSGTVIFPVFLGLGPAVNVTYVPLQKMWCVAPGVGASVGRTFSVGPIVGNASSMKSILEGASFSGGYQFTPAAGGGGSVNSSGVVSGNTFGVPGASATLTYGFCF